MFRYISEACVVVVVVVVRVYAPYYTTHTHHNNTPEWVCLRMRDIWCCQYTHTHMCWVSSSSSSGMCVCVTWVLQHFGKCTQSTHAHARMVTAFRRAIPRWDLFLPVSSSILCNGHCACTPVHTRWWEMHPFEKWQKLFFLFFRVHATVASSATQNQLPLWQSSTRTCALVYHHFLPLLFIVWNHPTERQFTILTLRNSDRAFLWPREEKAKSIDFPIVRGAVKVSEPVRY